MKFLHIFKALFSLLFFLGGSFLIFGLSLPFSAEDKWTLKSIENNWSYGGSIETISSNSFKFTTRANRYCLHFWVRCNKALISYREVEPPVEGRKIKFQFGLTVDHYNFDSPPKWLVIFQDWVRIGSNKLVGNRPISTLELKSIGKKLYLRHKDSSYLWGTADSKGKQALNGQLEPNLNTQYSVVVILTESAEPNGGRMELYVDKVKVSDERYQTKSATNWKENFQELGLYHDKTFNSNHDSNINVSITLSNVERILYR